MFGTNPFAPAMQSLPAGFMQWFLGLMAAIALGSSRLPPLIATSDCRRMGCVMT